MRKTQHYVKEHQREMNLIYRLKLYSPHKRVGKLSNQNKPALASAVSLRRWHKREVNGEVRANVAVIADA